MWSFWIVSGYQSHRKSAILLKDWRENDYGDWRAYNNNNNNNNNLHRRLPQTPRLPSTLSATDGNQNLPPGSPASFGPANNNGDRTADRSSDHFAGAPTTTVVKGGPAAAAAFQGYNGYAAAGHSHLSHHSHQNNHQHNNGFSDYYHPNTYSSHPNLIGRPNGVVVNGGGGGHHRKLPPLPNKPSALKLGQWRQSSLPEEHNPPGQARHVPPLQPSDRPVPLLQGRFLTVLYMSDVTEGMLGGGGGVLTLTGGKVDTIGGHSFRYICDER
jgi:hypothetical protein